MEFCIFLLPYFLELLLFIFQSQANVSNERYVYMQWFPCIICLYGTYKVWSQQGMFLLQFLLIEQISARFNKIIWNICTSLTQIEDIESSSSHQPKTREQRPQNVGNALSEDHEEFYNFPGRGAKPLDHPSAIQALSRPSAIQALPSQII